MLRSRFEFGRSWTILPCSSVTERNEDSIFMCKQYTSRVTFSPTQCACWMMCDTTLAQVLVRVIPSMCHALTLFSSVCSSYLFFCLNLDFYPFLFFIGAIFHWHSANGGVWPSGQQPTSHRLRAQPLRRFPLLRDHWNLAPGAIQQHGALVLAWVGKSVTRPSAGSLHHCSFRSEKNQRTVDKLITFLQKVCCQVSPCLRVMWERGDPYMS